jgi:hypothetical protein
MNVRQFLAHPYVRALLGASALGLTAATLLIFLSQGFADAVLFLLIMIPVSAVLVVAAYFTYDWRSPPDSW